MMRASLVVVALAFALGAACGGGGAPTKPVTEPVDRPPTRRVIEDTSQDDDDSGDGLEVVSTRGHMEPGDIEAGIAPHSAQLEACYIDKVGRRKWLGGKVQLTWQITKAGEVTSVVVADSDLGAWAIEKCLLEVARAATFAKPKGGDADFSLPLEFSAKGASVWWDEDVGVKAVGKRIDAIAKCAEGGAPADEVLITMYVGTRGKVQSVGFSSVAAVPDAWADCTAKAIESWTLADPRGKVAKLALRWRAP
jgi:TonB family protein